MLNLRDNSYRKGRLLRNQWERPHFASKQREIIYVTVYTIPYVNLHNQRFRTLCDSFVEDEEIEDDDDEEIEDDDATQSESMSNTNTSNGL